MKGIFLMEIRRSPGLVAFPLLVVFNVVVVLQDAAYWVGDWQATSIQAQYGNILVGPVIAACAAWAAGRELRTGYTPLAITMPRPLWRSNVLQWMAVTFWGLLAYGIGLGVTFSMTVPVAVAGGPWLSYVGLGAVAVCAFSAFGFGLGRLSKWRVVAPLAAVGAYAYFAILSYQNGWVSRLGLIHGGFPALPQYELRVSVVGLGLLWAAALVIFALVVAGTRRGTFAARAPLMVLASLPITASILTASMLQGGDFVRRPAPVHQVCEGRAPRVCVWPEHAKWADDAAEVAHRLAAALDGVSSLPPTIYEEGLPEAPSSEAAVVKVNSIPMTPPSFVTGFTAGILSDRPPVCSSDSGRRIENWVLIKAWMQMRAAGELGPDVHVDTARLQALLDLSPTQQKTWVRGNLPAATSCSAPVLPASLTSVQASSNVS